MKQIYRAWLAAREAIEGIDNPTRGSDGIENSRRTGKEEAWEDDLLHALTIRFSSRHVPTLIRCRKKGSDNRGIGGFICKKGKHEQKGDNDDDDDDDDEGKVNFRGSFLPCRNFVCDSYLSARGKAYRSKILSCNSVCESRYMMHRLCNVLTTGCTLVLRSHPPSWCCPLSGLVLFSSSTVTGSVFVSDGRQLLTRSGYCWVLKWNCEAVWAIYEIAGRV